MMHVRPESSQQVNKFVSDNGRPLMVYMGRNLINSLTDFQKH